MGSGSRLVLQPEMLDHAHGPAAIALGARQHVRAFAFGNGFTNVMGSCSRLVLKPDRLETRTWSCGDHTRTTTARACIRTRARARALYARVVRPPPRGDFSWFELTIQIHQGTHILAITHRKRKHGTIRHRKCQLLSY